MQLEPTNETTPHETAPNSPAAPKPAPPPPTAAPFFLAVGITMLFWGIVTSPIMSIGGLALLLWSLWTWISAIAKAWSH